MIAPIGVLLTLSGSVTPAIEIVSGTFSAGVPTIVNVPTGALLESSEDERLIGELQPLDMRQRIRSIRADGVGDRDDVIGIHSEIAGLHHAVERNGVIGAIASKHGRVEIRIRGVVDLAHDLELAGIVVAGQHVLDERHRVPRQDCAPPFHAVEGIDLGPGAVRIRPHADAHVEPGIAVDAGRRRPGPR